MSARKQTHSIARLQPDVSFRVTCVQEEYAGNADRTGTETVILRISFDKFDSREERGGSAAKQILRDLNEHCGCSA